MKLYLIRHAHSPSAQEAGVSDDFERPISEKGRLEASLLGRHLKKEAANPLLILTSPLLRARQTSQELALELQPAMGIHEAEFLSGGTEIPVLWKELLKTLNQKSVVEAAAVGHMPQVSELVARTCGKIVDFKPAGTACIEINGDKSQLLWFRNP